MKKSLGVVLASAVIGTATVGLAEDVVTYEVEEVAAARDVEMQRVWEALEAAESKIKDLESRSNMSPFTPPESLGLSEESKIDPVNTAYPIPKGDNLRLAQVHFNVSSVDLSPGGERLTREAAEWIKTLPSKKILVAGYSDTVGDAEVNKALSKERAEAVAKVLKDAGIDPDMIQVVGFGEEGAPEATGDEVAEPLNRCVGIFALPDSKSS